MLHIFNIINLDIITTMEVQDKNTSYIHQQLFLPFQYFHYQYIWILVVISPQLEVVKEYFYKIVKYEFKEIWSHCILTDSSHRSHLSGWTVHGEKCSWIALCRHPPHVPLTRDDHQMDIMTIQPTYMILPLLKDADICQQRRGKFFHLQPCLFQRHPVGSFSCLDFDFDSSADLIRAIDRQWHTHSRKCSPSYSTYFYIVLRRGRGWYPPVLFLLILLSSAGVTLDGP